MVQAARDARLLRSLLHAPPPKGVRALAWRRYLAAEIAPRVRQVLHDLKQPLDGPVATRQDLDERATATYTPPPRAAPTAKRRRCSLAERLAVEVDRADPMLGDTLDERLDALVTLALAANPGLRQSANPGNR